MTDTTPPSLAAAYVAAQAELSNPHKGKTADTGSYSYAYVDLATVLDHTRAVLAKHGLAIVQDVATHEATMSVTTIVMHSSGECMTFGPIVGSSGKSWQEFGSAVTYARRYSLLAALGLAGDDDTDGADAGTSSPTTPAGSSTPNPRNLRGPAARQLTGPASSKQIGMLKGLMRSHGVDEVQLASLSFDRHGFELPVEGLDKLTKGQASALIEELLKLDGGKPVERLTSPPVDDPWQGAPLVDPLTGEAAE